MFPTKLNLLLLHCSEGKIIILINARTMQTAFYSNMALERIFLVFMERNSFRYFRFSPIDGADIKFFTDTWMLKINKTKFATSPTVFIILSKFLTSQWHLAPATVLL